MNIRYVFFGTPEFAAIILEKLIGAGLPPAGVVCNPDRPVGRKKTITPPPTKVLAVKHGISVFQPDSFPDSSFQILAPKFDFAVVAAYSKIIPHSVIKLFPKGVIGVHPSLLPKYRGATPIQSAILAGEKETGVTLYSIDEKVDHGAILANSKFQMANPKINYGELEKELARLAADLLIKFLPDFEKTGDNGVPQNEAEATFTKKFSTRDGFVDLEKDEPAVIERKVRALNPEPGVWTMKDGKRMKILKAEILDGKLKPLEIQYEGGKPKNI